MTKILFLASGNGGNLKLFHKFIKVNARANCEIVGVVSDRYCGATEFAYSNDIPTIILPNFQKDINNNLKKFDFDFAFTGIHKILPDNCLETFGSKFLNVHYSLLPKYKGIIGMAGVKKAIINKDLEIGATVHKITSKVDSGPKLNQGRLQNDGNVDLDTIKNTIFQVGFILLLNEIINVKGIEYYESRHFDLKDITVTFNKVTKIFEIYKSENFWKL